MLCPGCAGSGNPAARVISGDHPFRLPAWSLARLSGSTMNETLHTKKFISGDRRRSFTAIETLERLQEVELPSEPQRVIVILAGITTVRLKLIGIDATYYSAGSFLEK